MEQMAAIAQSLSTYAQLQQEQNRGSSLRAEPSLATRYRENRAQHHDLGGLEVGESLEKVLSSKVSHYFGVFN